MLLKLVLVTVGCMIIGLIPLVGLPGAVVMLVSIPGILIFDLITGVDSFKMISGSKMWPFAIYLTLTWPIGLIPGYLISKHGLSNLLPLPLAFSFILSIVIWCNLCTVALLSYNLLSDRKDPI